MSFLAPVICKVACAVFHHTHADRVKLLCAPECSVRFAFVLCRDDLRSMCYAKWDVFHVHEVILSDLGGLSFNMRPNTAIDLQA